MKLMKVSVIVQSTHEQQVRDALAAAGAGVVGDYRACQFVTKGEAQFLPTKDADPAIGEKQELNIVDAVQIQTWCSEEDIEKVVRMVKEAHPNEEPGIELSSFEMR